MSKNPYIHESVSNNSPVGYHAEDRADSDFFIEGSVRTENGQSILTFIVLVVKSDQTGKEIRSQVRGSEFFDAMWEHFQAEGTRIDVIQAEWTSAPLSSLASFTTNLDAFNRALSMHPTLEVAALHGTPTGKYAKNKGYTLVTIIQTDPPSSTGQSGPYTDVIVRFREPSRF